MKRRLLLAGVLSLLVSLSVFSQGKTIVIVGSSTAEGIGASIPELSYVGLLRSEFNKNSGDGIDTSVISLAVAGYTTYKAMPDDFVMPPNRTETIDKNNNITKAFTYNPDIVIINFPSNDQDPKYGYSVAETMSNLRLMYSRVVQTGATCFVTTSQPRTQYPMQQKKQLKALADSVKNAFGIYTIDFWDVLLDNTDDLNIKNILNKDNVHVNDLGHELLFETILAKNIFNPLGALPLKLTAFQARPNRQGVDLIWRVELEEPATYYEIERSANGIAFVTVSQQKGMANRDQRMEYSWTDLTPLSGKNFYRLKIIEPDGIRYSPIVNCSTAGGTTGGVIARAFASSTELFIDLADDRANQPVTLRVIDPSGQVLASRQYRPGDNAQLRIPFGNAAPGLYIVQALTADGRTSVKRLVKAH